MTQLDLFSALTTIAAAAQQDEHPDEAHPEPGQPPKRTQITGPLPGTTWEHAFHDPAQDAE